MAESVPPATTGAHLVTSSELFWLVAGMWLSGACLLALLPVVLAPRLGRQILLQRALGPQAAMIRMLALVSSAAVVAYYVRAVLALVPGGGA